MNNSEFYYWLSGYCLCSEYKKITSYQIKIIKNHLNLVFAVEEYLDETNQWLDKEILKLTVKGKIAEPTDNFIQKVYDIFKG